MVGPRTQYNPPFAGKDKLVRKASFKSSGMSTLIFAVSRAFTPVFAPAFALGLSDRYMDKDLQRITKLALESFVQGQEYGQLQANPTPGNRQLKARNSDLYYRHLYIECYYLYWQYKDYFNMADVTESKRIFFITFFFHNKVKF